MPGWRMFVRSREAAAEADEDLGEDEATRKLRAELKELQALQQAEA